MTIEKIIKKTIIFSIYKWLKYERWQPKKIELANILNSLKINPNGVIVQIGAYDGITGDPLMNILKNKNWKAILVEPQLHAFCKLKKKYNDNKRIHLVNCAISNSIGYRTLYRPKGSLDSVLASFDPVHVMNHYDKNIKLEEEIVQTISLQNLLDRFNIECIDILAIDTEGFDYEIIKQINFQNISPYVIIYEYHHLSHKEYKQSLRDLKSKGYSVFKEKLDVIAIKK